MVKALPSSRWNVTRFIAVTSTNHPISMFMHALMRKHAWTECTSKRCSISSKDFLSFCSVLILPRSSGPRRRIGPLIKRWLCILSRTLKLLRRPEKELKSPTSKSSSVLMHLESGLICVSQLMHESSFTLGLSRLTLKLCSSSLEEERGLCPAS